MINYSIILKSQLEGAQRIDAEYFSPEYLETESRLRALKTITVGEASESVVNFGAYSLCNYIEWKETGIPYLNVENIKDGYIDFEGVKFIDEEVNNILKKSKVKEGQVIITMAGTIGNVAVAHNIPAKVNSNQATAKITLKKDFSPYFLAAFLSCDYGKKQTEREIVSSVQPNIFLWQIKDFKVPLIKKDKEKEVEEIYKNGLEAFGQSRLLYCQAQDLLLQELGLKDFIPQDNSAYVVNLSDIKSAHRIDAEYFRPKYKMIEDKLIKKLNAKKIKDLDFIQVTTGQYSEEYVNTSKGKPYIRGTDLAMGTVKLDDLVYIDPTKQISSKKAKEGDVVVTRVGTIGIAARLPKEVEGGTISDNLIRLRFSEENLSSFYTCLFLNTIGSQLMIKESRGSVQARLNQETLKEIALPTLPKPSQLKIEDLVRKSHAARKRAKELLEEAKRKVEEFIEKR